MTRTILASLLFVLAGNAFAQTKTDKTDYNFGFEKVFPRQKLPDGWIQEGKANNITVDATNSHSGRNSLLIEATDSSTPNSFGRAICVLPAIYSGQVIELTAFIKTKGVINVSEGLSLIIAGPREVLKEKQQRCPKGTNDWKIYRLKVSYPQNAEKIIIGLGLNGTGQIWIDDIELFIDGNDISQAQPRFQAIKDTEFANGY